MTKRFHKFHTIYKYVGQFNNVTDVQNIFNRRKKTGVSGGEEIRTIFADDVIKYMESGDYANFDESFSGQDLLDKVLEETDYKYNELTKDRKYLVRMFINDSTINNEENGDFDECSSTIEIYEFSHVTCGVDYAIMKSEIEREGYDEFILHLGFSRNKEEMSERFTDFDTAYRHFVFQLNRDDIKYINFEGVKKKSIYQWNEPFCH